MSALRSVSCCIRSLRRLSFLRPLPASFPHPTSSRGNSKVASTPAPGNPKLHVGHCVNKPPALLTAPSRGGGWTAASRGACTLRPRQRKQRAAKFPAWAGPPPEEHDGSADSTPSGACLSVCIRCCKRDADSLSESLLCFGATSASMDELSDFDDMDEICITSIFTDDQDVHMCISTAAKSIGLDKTPDYEVTVSEQYNWINIVKETFNPIQVTDGLWVVPEWRTPPDIHATNIILNPGMAFGTGDHPTTKLCLLLLHDSVKGGENFLDYGTGSGILGIAALKMGAGLSVGIDIDPQALSSARENIALNKIDPVRMELYLAPGKGSVADQTHARESNTTKEKFDIIVANILLNPLLELAEELVSYGKPGAVVGLSGIISEQVFFKPFSVLLHCRWMSNFVADSMCFNMIKRFILVRLNEYPNIDIPITCKKQLTGTGNSTKRKAVRD